MLKIKILIFGFYAINYKYDLLRMHESKQTIQSDSQKVKKSLVTPFFRWIMVTLIISVQGLIYRDPTPYFNSFYCTLGPKTNSESGDYICPSPRVIPRADKFALALVEFNKVAGKEIYFKAKITTAAGSNLASVTINLQFTAAYTTKYGYMVAAVGYQTENNWIDLINVEVYEIFNALVTANTSGHKLRNFTYPWPAVTTRITLDSAMNTNWTYACFVSSFQGAFASPGDRVNVWFGHAQTKTSLIVFKLDVAQYVSVKTFFGGIIFFKYVSKPAGVEYYSMSLQFMYNQPNDIYKTAANSKMFGPPFDGKCLIVTYFFEYRSAFTLELVNSNLNNYYKVAIIPSTSFQINTFATLFCIADKTITQCGQFEYEDSMTNACFDSGAACPAPTPTSLAGKKWCLKCTGIQCLTCDVTNRSICLNCDSALFTTASSGACVCMSTYGRILGPMSQIGACALCSSAVPNCIQCIFVGDCRQCTTGLFYNSNFGLYGTCQDCPTFRSNCAVCANDGKCTQCIANYWPDALGACLNCPNLHTNCLTCDPTDGKCTQCAVGFGIISSGDCSICSFLYSNCVECATDTGGCTLCFADATTQYWLDSSSQCVDCQTLHPHCTACSPPPNKECTTCDLGFGITASDDCDTCSTLYSNCLLCDSYNTGCNQCKVSFGIDSSAHCDACSSLYSPECLKCVHYAQGCTKCTTGYGIDSTGQCTICSTLYSNCNLCNSYNTGCKQCQATYGLNSSSQCQPCQVLYPNCNLCLSSSGGCNECKTTYGVDFPGTCDLCSIFIPDCYLCTSYNAACTQCSPGFVLGPVGQCSLCSRFYTNCDSCNTYNGGCTLCIATYGVTSLGQCKTCTSFYSNCAKCESYNGGCTECVTGFGITSSEQCAACSTLYNANCISCVSYNGGCTQCKTGFGYASSGQCTACSTLYPNCLLCASYNTGCTSCSSGYGISVSGSCQLCSILYTNCALCTSHDTGCTQCKAISNVYLLSNKLCKTCSDITPQCILCQPDTANSDLICTQCARGYYLNSSQNSCIQCSTAIFDCEECYFNTTVSKVRCTLCSDQYLVDDRFLCQKCKVNVYYERMCYYLPGCSSLAVINGTLICLACTLPNFEFSIKIKKCVCQKGYNFSTVDDTCNGNCGEGLKVPTEGCDDGNLINGDGCNDLCKVETNYKCEENNNSKSVCVFTQDIKITFDYIMKIEGENKAEIYFKVDPAPTTLSAVDWQKTINLSFIDLTKKPVVSCSYENGVLIVSFVYFEDLEGKFCEMNAKFDSSLIASSSQYSYFQIKASNAELKYASQSLGQTHKTVGIISFALGIMALVCFVISNYFHKLIGLETIQLIQLIYFSRIVFSGDAQSNVLAFNSLKYSNGYSELNLSGAKADANAAEIPPIFFKIQLQMYYLDNCNTMIIPIILATVAYVVYFLRRTRALSAYKETKQILIRDNIVDMGRKITWIYENFIFPYTLFLLYLTLFQMLVYELSDLSDQSEVSNLYVRTSFSFSLLILVYIFLIFCTETISGFKDYFNAQSDKSNQLEEDKTLTDERHKDHHPLYVSFYLLYQLSLIVLVNTALLNFTYLAQVMAGAIIFYSIVFFCWRPYALNIHNYANIYNQTVLMMFFALQILGKKNLLNETFSIVSLQGTLSLIVVAIAIQIARVYVHNKSEKRKFNVKKEIKKKPEALKIIKPINPYAFEKKISQMMKKSEQIEKEMNDMLETTILGKEQLRRRLRQQKALEDRNNSQAKSKQTGYVESDKEMLRKLKERMRRGQKPHQEWMFR